MSIPVPIERLLLEVETRGESAYLLTVSDDGRPHAVHVPVRWQENKLAVEAGKRSAANAAARPAVSLLYTMREPGDYSLIIDGTAVISAGTTGPVLLITPTAAVLHRPAKVPDPSSACGADCVPLLSPQDAKND